MKAHSNFLLQTVLYLFGVGQIVAAEADWPRFRGPNGSGIAVDAAPPVTWTDKQHLKWKRPLPGPGTSSPIVVSNKVFITSWTGPGTGGGALQRHLVCLNRADGAVLWSKAVAGEADPDAYSGFLQDHGYASHTPACDGERVYVYFGRAGALAFDLEGKELWRVNLGNASNSKNWGSAASPVVYKDMVIICASEESHAVYALDQRTGKQRWKAPGDALDYVFSTPVLATHEGRTDLLVSMPDELWGLNPDTGKLRWYAQTRLPGNISPGVLLGDGVAYAFGGFPRTGAVAVKLGGQNDVTQTHLQWAGNTSTYVPTPVLHEGRLYCATDNGYALCLDAKSGEVVFRERLEDASATGRGGKPFYASAVLAGGNVYAVSRRNGTFVFAAAPQFKLVARNLLESDKSQCNATPAIVGRQLFLRTDAALYCFEKPAKP